MLQFQLGITLFLGGTTTSLAQKKARLIFSNFERTKSDSPYPIQIVIDPFKVPFVNHSNLFSREKLDIGTRFLLEHIPRGNYQDILDLGCANGVVGIAAKMANPSAKIIFSDDSQMAVQSAMLNYGRFFEDKARFQWINCYENQEPGSVDLVLCNPPFHQGHTITDFTARQMFADAHRALRMGGIIRVIGNSHLQYQIMLKKIFGNSQIVKTNQKFMIIDAKR